MEIARVVGVNRVLAPETTSCWIMVVAVRFIQKGGDLTGRSPFEWRRPPPSSTRHKEKKKLPLPSVLRGDDAQRRDGSGAGGGVSNLKKR